LAAIASPDGVRLSWTRPLQYTGGKKMNDLGGFTIERSPDEGGPPAYTKIATVEIEDRDRYRKDRHIEWLDQDVTQGMRYLYRVTSFTLDGYQSPTAGPVAVRFGPAPKEPAP